MKKSIQITTILCILGIILFTKMSFAQVIKVGSGGNVGVNGNQSGSHSLTVHGDLKVTGNIAGHDNTSTYGYMTMGGNSNTVEIVAGNQQGTYALYVYGDAGGIGPWGGFSDLKLKENIQYLDKNQMLSKIQTIRGTKYQFKTREELIQMHENNQLRFTVETVDLESERANLLDEYGSVSDSMLQQEVGYDKTTMVDGKQYGLRILAPYLSGRERIGLIAQEIKDDFPELVKYDSARMQYSVNYDGFVPVLLESVKAQQEQVKEKALQMNNNSASLTNLEDRTGTLEAEIDTFLAQCCSSTVENKSNPTGSLKTKKVELSQSNAGSFTEDTRIGYVLPESTSKATLYLYDKQGAQVKRFNISNPGKGSITLKGGSLQPGLYMYTLVADGKVMDTKRVVLKE